MPELVLRPYQQKCLTDTSSAWRAGYRAPLLNLPTGGGKGVIAAKMVQLAVARGKRVQFWVNRKIIVDDFSKRLGKLSVPHGVIMGNDPRRKPGLSTHVVSIDTLHRRQYLPEADLIIIDECRFAVSDIWRKTLDRYPKSTKILGMDATPVRGDGRGLSEFFDVIIPGPSVEELIDEGFLVPSITFRGEAPNTSRIKKAGDGTPINNKALAEVSNTPKLIGDIVGNWQRISPGRKTVTFGVNKAHAVEIAESFRCAGVQCAYVDDETPDKERDKIWEDLDFGHLVNVASVGTIGYGWDHPIISTVIQARTAGLSVHLQQIGRGSRPYPGKTELFVLDHGGNYDAHGCYEQPRTWSLEGRALVEEDATRQTYTIDCKQCRGTFRIGRTECPYCGAPVIREERKIEVIDADLQEVRHRMVCGACKREMPGRPIGFECGIGGCQGRARRAYQIDVPSKNPRIAELQQIAQRNAASPEWLARSIQEQRRQIEKAEVRA